MTFLVALDQLLLIHSGGCDVVKYSRLPLRFLVLWPVDNCTNSLSLKCPCAAQTLFLDPDKL